MSYVLELTVKNSNNIQDLFGICYVTTVNVNHR